MPRIFKGIESELRLLLHPCILTGEITDIKVALFTNDPSVAIEFTDRYTIDDNILTLTVPTWAFGTMEEGVINYVIQGMHNDDAFITDRQSNYYLKTPTDYIPEEIPEEVVLGELTTMIVENGVFEYTPTDVDAWNKATIEVNVPDTNGSYDEGYASGKDDGYESGYQDGYNQGQADCPEGGDNYNRVFVNTFELQQYMEAQGITELNDICVFGTVGAIQNISDGKATYWLDGAMVVDGSRFDFDPDFDETKLKIGAQIALKGDAVYNADAEYLLTINNSFLINYELGQGKRYTATSNGQVFIDPDYDSGYTKLNTVILDVEVEGGANLNEFYGTIRENGTYEYLPSDNGLDGFSKVTIDANIPTPKASVKTEGEVKSIIDTEGRVEDVYIQGAVTEIEQYRNGRLTFWIGGLRIGNAKDVGGINFTDENKIKVGDNVIIFSTSGMYAITRERYEFSNCELIAICTNENGGTCNLIKESFSIKGDWEQFTASDYGADGFESVAIDAYDYGKQKFNEGYEEGKNQGGTVTTYPTIKDIYNTEDVTTEVNFKGTVAVCLQGSSSYYMIVTDHTGAIYVIAKQPYDVGDECFLAGVVRKTNSTNMRYMSNPIIEVLSKGNYVVMPTDAVELTNKDELYVPNEYGNAEMKYLYYQGEVQKIASNGNITIITPESVSAEGQITLRAAKEEWRSNLVIGDYIRMYMFTTNGDGFFLPTDIIKLGTEGGSCNLEDKMIAPSMGDRDDNGYIVVEESEGFDGLERVVIDPTTIYNEGVEEGKNQGGGSGDCNIQNQKRVELNGSWEVFYPDEGYDGVYEIVVDAYRKAEEWQEDGKNNIRNKLQSIDITENGRYSVEDLAEKVFIVFDGNSYFDTGIVPTEQTKIEVMFRCQGEIWYEDMYILGCSQLNLHIGGTALNGKWAEGQTGNIPYYENVWTSATFDRDNLCTNNGCADWNEGDKDSGWGGYNETIKIGKLGDEQLFKQQIAYVKIWVNKDDDSTMTLFRPKNMAQGGFGLVNSDGIEYSNISNLGEGTTTFMSELGPKYGEGWKEINVNVDTQAFYNQGFADATSFNKIAMEIETDVYSKLEFLTDYSFVTTSGDNSPKSLMFDMPINYIWSYRDVSDGIAELRQNAFKDYSKIMKVKTNTIMTLGERAFKDAFELTEIDMSNLIGRIATEAFDGCSKLAKIICRATGNVVLGSAPFNGLPENGVLYLKEGVNETPWLEKLPSGWTVERI